MQQFHFDETFCSWGTSGNICHFGEKRIEFMARSTKTFQIFLISFCSIFTQQFLIRIIDLQYDFMSFFKSKNITFKSLTSFFVPLLEGSSSLRYFNGIVISLKIVWSSTPPLQSSTRGFLEGGVVVVKDSALLDN